MGFGIGTPMIAQQGWSVRAEKGASRTSLTFHPKNEGERMTKMETKVDSNRTESVGGEGSMTLLNLTNFPPGGWLYREVTIGWQNPDPLNGEGLDHAVKMLQTVRAQNPAANLDPTYSACRDAIVRFTCHRLKYDPRWCGLPPAELQKVSSALPKGVTARRKCASCGRR